MNTIHTQLLENGEEGRRRLGSNGLLFEAEWGACWATGL